MQKLRIIPWLLGVALILTTLAGANRLLHPGDPSSAGGPPVLPPKAAPAAANDGLVAKGTVYSDPPTVAYTLPAHLPAGTVVEVKVNGGQEVNAGNVLVVFDDAMLKQDLAKAESAYSAAAQDYQKAMVKQKALPLLIEKAQLALAEAEQKRDTAKEAVALANKTFDKEIKRRKDAEKPLTPQEVEEFRSEDLNLFQTQAALRSAEHDVSAKRLDLKQLVEIETETLQLVVTQAAFAANSLKADVEKVKLAIRDCTLGAKVAGTVEQVTASAGQVVYPQTRPPLLYLVPKGKRVVWAEVVPEFAHKINGREGQKVQISDESNTHLVYEGVVKRIGTTFLPKPNGAPEILNGKPNLVLIVEIEVIDPTPPGKPPLRVGQPVRVIFP